MSCPYCGEPPEDEAALEGGETIVCGACGHEYTYDAPEDVAEMYERQEEEDRERWIPGYKEAKEELAKAEGDYWKTWRLGDAPPEALERLREKVRELHARKGIPPWEQSA